MRTMKLIQSIMALVAVFALSSSQIMAQESRSVSVKNFNGLSVSSGIDLYLTQGSTESLVIKGKSDVIENVEIEQKGSDVHIKYKSGMNWSSMWRNQTIKVYVSYKTLERLSASGGSDVFSQNAMRATDLTINASGGSDIKLALNCKNLALSVSGGADVELRGTGENFSVSASGGADVNAYDFVVNYAKASVSGGADANLHVNKGLDAAASGGGDVSYKGSAVLKRTNSSKSGDVRRVN